MQYVLGIDSCGGRGTARLVALCSAINYSTYLFFPQVVIVILLSFTYRRVHLCKRVLWGVPGLVVYVTQISNLGCHLTFYV